MANPSGKGGFLPGHVKRGGRKKGTPHKVTSDLQALAAKLKMTPAELLIRRCATPEPKKKAGEKNADFRHRWEYWEAMTRDAAAKAAPFVHPKLSAIEVSGDEDSPLRYRFEMTVVHASRDGTKLLPDR